MNHLVTLRINFDECRNNKIDLFFYFIDFRKSFDIILKTKDLEKVGREKGSFSVEDYCEKIV